LEELHICLWGDDNFKNYTPLLELGKTATTLVLGQEHDFDAIRSALISPSGHPQVLNWPTIPLSSHFETLEQRITQTKAKSVFINLSSGARESAMVLYHWALSQDIPCYIIDDEDQLHWLPPYAQEVENVADLANLKAYFRVHQINLRSHGFGLKINDSLNNLVEDWIRSPDKYTLFRTLNGLASSAKPTMQNTLAPSFSTSLTSPWESSPIYSLLLDLIDQDIAEVDNKTVTFKDEASKFFCNGGWLELFVYNQIKALKTQVPEIQDIRLGQEVSYQNMAKNELDVVFLADNQLYLIEVKTSYLSDKVDAANQIVYKLEALKEILGEDVKGMVVSLFDMPKSSIKRAGLYDLEIVSGGQLLHLKSRLKQWINE